MDCPVDCEPGAMFDPASTSEAFVMPICVDVSLAELYAESAANAPNDSAESTIAAEAVVILFMMFFSY